MKIKRKVKKEIRFTHKANKALSFRLSTIIEELKDRRQEHTGYKVQYSILNLRRLEGSAIVQLSVNKFTSVSA